MILGRIMRLSLFIPVEEREVRIRWRGSERPAMPGAANTAKNMNRVHPAVGAAEGRRHIPAEPGRSELYSGT